MIRILALLSLLATTGCVVYPYGYGGYGYGGYGNAGYGYGGYGYAAPYAYPGAYRGNAPTASDYNPVSGVRTGN